MEDVRKWPITKYLKHLLWIKMQVDVDEDDDSKDKPKKGLEIPSMPSIPNVPRNVADLKKLMRQMPTIGGRSGVSRMAYQFR